MSIAVVAHPARRRHADLLAMKVSADAVFYDVEGIGCEANHLNALRWHAQNRTTPNEFKVVLEDDAIPTHNFRPQLNKMLAVAPADIVGLYLGTGYPIHWQAEIRTAVPPDADPHFLTAPALLNCVGYAVRACWLTSLVHEVSWETTGVLGDAVPIDRAITDFCRKRSLDVAYCRPSIINHNDILPSQIPSRLDGQSRDRPRVAWKFGRREEWEPTSVAIPEPELAYVDDEGRSWYKTREKVYEGQ